MQRRRYGTFRLKWETIERYPQLVKRIMGDCIIFRAESLYHQRCIEYMAESDWFDPSEEGCQPPEYSVVVALNGRGFSFCYASSFQIGSPTMWIG